MKNLKKLISVIIAVIMIVGSFATVSAADYKDVESANSFYKAINVLSGLGIVNGDDEGNFNPKNEIKRSEMVALVCRAMGETDIATNSASNAFTDVAANHWAAGYIAWGVNRGIVNGMGDGTFAPDASVSYQDAVVMIMRALGYDRIAQRAQNGGYPAGYLKLASQRGVLKDAGYDNQAAAPREVVAQLIYNAMTAPLVDVKQYGMNVEDDRYIIHDGSDTDAPLRTLLTYTNDVYKVKADVIDTAKTNDALIDKDGSYKVKLNVSNTYGYAKADVYEEIGIDLLGDNANKVTVYTGKTDAADLLGATVEAYLVEDEDLNGWKLLAVVADAKSVKSETLKATEVEFTDYAALTFTYEDADGQEEEIELASGFAVYYNGNLCTTTFANDDAIEALLLRAQEITFTGSRTGDYDKVFVTEYQYAQVEEVNAEDLYIIADPYTVELDAEVRGNRKFTYGLYDGEGNEISLEDIAEDDILNILAPLEVAADGTVAPEEDLDEIGYMDIYVTNEVVTGSITEFLSDGSYSIDGAAYKGVEADMFTSDSVIEGTFFLTIDGRILAHDTSSTVAKDFGFLVAAYSDSKYGGTMFDNVIRIFTAEGKVVDFEVASRLTVDGVAKTERELSGESGYIVTDIATKAVEGDKADVEASVYNRLVTYKLNADGELKEITFVDGSEDNHIYRDDLNRFGGKKLDDTSKLFIAPVTLVEAGCATGCTEDHEHEEGCATACTEEHEHEANVYGVDEDDIKIGTFDAMKNATGHNAKIVSLDGKVLSAAIMYKNISSDYAGSHLAVVKSMSTTYDKGYDAFLTRYTLIQSGKEVEVAINPEGESADVTLNIGDVILYALDADKYIDSMLVVWDGETFNNRDYTVADHDFTIVKSAIEDIDEGIMTLADGKVYELLADEEYTYASIDVTDGAPKASDIKALRSASNLRETNLRNVYTAITILTEAGFEDVVMIIDNYVEA